MKLYSDLRSSAWPTHWIVPDWPVPSHVKAVCTTRDGGVSVGPWASLNLGAHVGDDMASVQTNRAVLAQAIGVRPVFLQQVHGVDVAGLDAWSADDDVLLADACTTADAGIACTIMVADCLPVLLTDSLGTVVAAAHAGWRGLAGEAGYGVLESIYERFSALAHNSSPHGAINTIAWLGPCIGPSAFEVGSDVRAAFVTTDPGAADLFRASNTPGKWWAHLAGLARRRLHALGVTQVYGNDGSDGWCTVGNPSRFFSYRRDQVALGGSGRLAACVWLDSGSVGGDNLP